MRGGNDGINWLAPEPYWRRRLIGPLLAFLTVIALCAAAMAQQGAPNSCSGTVGATAAAVSFPQAAAGGGPPSPMSYVTIQNIHASQNLGVNAMPNGTAAIGTPGTFLIVPGASITWANPQYPAPAVISIIGSGASTTYTCGYR